MTPARSHVAGAWAARGRAWLTIYGPLISVVAGAALAAAPLFSDRGFLLTRGIGDSPNLLFRLQQLLTDLQAGEFPARWMPDAAYGYGLPYFTYYASASTYLAALLKLSGFSFVGALKWTQALALLTAALGLFGWQRALGRPAWGAALAAAAYTFAPFHLVNLYVRGDSLAELWAMALFPLTLWAAQRCRAGASRGWAAALAVSLAALIVTHNISALLFLPFVALALVTADVRRWLTRPRREALMHWLWTGLAALLGLALSAFFWLPALGEGDAVQLGDLTQGFFFYGNHFRAADLFQTTALFDYAGQPFSLGLAQAALAGIGLGVWLWRARAARRWSGPDIFILLGLVGAVLMITPLSAPLWAALPLIRYAQFPWRFLSIAALFLAALTGHLVTERRPAVVALLLMAALAAAALLPLRLSFIPLTDTEVTAERLNLYEYFTTAIGNTVNSEYLPRDVAPRPFTSAEMLGRAPQVKALSGTASGVRAWKRGAAEQWRITVAAGAPATVAVPTYFWPGWQGAADGQPLAVRAAAGLGWLKFDLPPGVHTVNLSLGRTPLRAGAEALSAAAVLALLGMGVWRPGRPLRLWRPGRWALGLLLGGLGIALLRGLSDSAAAAGPLSMDFDTAPYPYEAPVQFEGGQSLTRVAYSADHLSPGQVFTVETGWAGADRGRATLKLVTPYSRLMTGAPDLDAATLTIEPQANNLTATARLTVPLDTAPGVYFMTVEYADALGARQALLSSGRRRGLVYLAPLWVDGPPSTVPQPTPLATLGGQVQLLALTGGLRPSALWRTLTDLPRNYQVAYRLRDAAGNEWAAQDAQPRAGFYPSALWRPGEEVRDDYGPPAADGLPPGDYQFAFTWYDAATLQPLGPPVQVTRTITERYARGPRVEHFSLTPGLGLETVDFPKQIEAGATLDLAAHWLTGPAPLPHYRARWTLTSEAGTRLTQTLDLAPGSPTERWPAEAYLLGRAHWPLANDLLPGRYALSIQLLDDAGQPVGTEAGLGMLQVTGRPRAFTAPPLANRVDATFDGQLKLLGYDLTQTETSLQLTLTWQALAAPRGSYKYFVHLFRPADESIAAQVDALPRDNTYPTTLWLKDEVVTDTLRLSLANVPPGQYRLAVGWYDPASPTLDRLPARDAQGQPLAADRVLLATPIQH